MSGGYYTADATMIDTKLLSNIDRRLLEVSGALDNILKPQEAARHVFPLISQESDELYGENIYFSGEQYE